MTREEAIKIINCYDIDFYDLSGEKIPADKLADACDMAIEALEGVCFDEWCTDCKEYDTEKKCCPRFNRVIRGALKREPSEDGTLEIKVENATKIGRVLISDDKHRGGLYYPDEDEPQGDLISRADAMMEARPEYLSPEQIGHEEYNKGWSDAISMYWANLNALPAKTQDRPTDGDLISRADAIEALGEEPPVWCDEEYEIAERDQWRADIEAIKSVPSADRPRGEWVDMNGNPVPLDEDGAPTNSCWCSECGEWLVASDEYSTRGNFCPNCGADMRGENE